MNALALVPAASKVPSPAGQSLEDAILETEPNEPGERGVPRANVVDTLSAEDGVANANLDERLMHRDLKARLFGAEGRVTIGRYEVVRRIGRGGMGTVYVAHDPELDRKIALKVLRADRRSGRERMLQEARALAKLAHPNVVAVHEVGLHDERVFVAMELVEGKTLRTWLEAKPSRTSLYEVFLQAARGLQAAHRAGLVHRDFKPDNVLIGDDGRVRVVDFGVAKATDSLDPSASGEGVQERGQQGASAGDGGSRPELTLTGQLLGTPAYMAAEQFLGASVDARTDVFAFSVTLYEALTGRRPFDGDDTASVSWSVLQGQPRPLEASDVPAQLVALVKQGLAREADRRPASMDGFVAALQAASAPARPQRRQGLRVAGAVVSAMALGGGLLMMGSEPEGGDPSGSMAMAAAAPVEVAEEDPAEVAAFAAIVAATDDAARLAAAEAYLGQHGQRGSGAHRAVAHSVAGDVLWRGSCASAVLGLCVEEPKAAAGAQCPTLARGAYVPRTRDEAKTKAALEHLEQALELAGTEPPQDASERKAFATALGRARVQRADHRLERFFAVTIPASLDFASAKSLSSDAFKLYYTEKSRLGMELVLEYAAVKKSLAPHWVLVAASRSGLLSESFAADMMGAPVPTTVSPAERDEYCKELGVVVADPLEKARQAYDYCAEKAAQYDIALPEVQWCRDRLAALGAPKPVATDAKP